jgi:hypothetical protein
MDIEEINEELGIEDSQFWAGLKSTAAQSLASWSRRWEQRYDDDDVDDEEQGFGSRMGIVQLGLLVIVLGSIALAFVDSFSTTGYWSWKNCKESFAEQRFFTSPSNRVQDGNVKERGVHVIRDLTYKQDSNTAASFSSIETDSTSTSAGAATATPQRVFQVDAPVLGAGGFIFDGDNVTASSIGSSADGNTNGVTGEDCSVTLMVFSFAGSFGKPFVGSLLVSS